MWKIVVLDRDTLSSRSFELPFEHELVEYSNTLPEETAARLVGADIVITNKVKITAEHFAQNPQLKLIAVSATGYNNIDVDAAQKAGVSVCNVAAYGTESVAEHVMMMILALMRNLPAYQRDMAAGMWQKSPFFCHFGAPMRDVNGKTLAIFGRGAIGLVLAKYAQAFNMKVIFAEHKNAQTVRDGYVAFDDALQQADVISLHCPFTESTRNLIDERELKMMKAGALLINCGRGGLVNEEALLAALKYGTLGGAGVDVLTQEPPVNGNPLLNSPLPNLIITPHMAWAGEEAQANLFAILQENIRAFVSGKPQNIVA